MRATPRTTESAVGSAPPDSEVPAPRGITGTPSAEQTRSAAATSPVDRGNTTARGGHR